MKKEYLKEDSDSGTKSWIILIKTIIVLYKKSVKMMSNMKYGKSCWLWLSFSCHCLVMKRNDCCRWLLLFLKVNLSQVIVLKMTKRSPDFHDNFDVKWFSQVTQSNDSILPGQYSFISKHRELVHDTDCHDKYREEGMHKHIRMGSSCQDRQAWDTAYSWPAQPFSPFGCILRQIRR